MILNKGVLQRAASGWSLENHEKDQRGYGTHEETDLGSSEAVAVASTGRWQQQCKKLTRHQTSAN